MTVHVLQQPSNYDQSKRVLVRRWLIVPYILNRVIDNVEPIQRRLLRLTARQAPARPPARARGPPGLRARVAADRSAVARSTLKTDCVC